MTTSREKFGLAFGITGVLLFGGTLPATRVAVTVFDPLFLSAARAAIAGCAGLLLLVAMRRPPPPRAFWRDLVLAGACTIIGFPVFMALAMAHVPASHGGVVLGIIPLATTAAATLVAHERPSLGFWLASAAGATVVFVFMVRQSQDSTVELGDLYLLGTVISGAFGYALSGRLSRKLPGWEVISWQVAAFLPLSLLAAGLLVPATFANTPAPAWAGLAYVSFISQFFAFFVFNRAMAMGGVARVGQLMLLQPFVIVALSVPVNGERFQASTLLYAAAVVAAVVVGQRMQVARR
ncbi:MAG TPA: DMT family transporter [Pseudolabrys sp.]|jgi:drug/metabolite transporter (DMT)-like permease|nr:DMT family transporter [Pseudolabrys sp.]